MVGGRTGWGGAACEPGWPPRAPGRTEETVWPTRGGPPCANAGDKAAPAVNSSNAAVTRRCAADWVAPASGTCDGRPTLRAAALISTITHHTSWSQASQMTIDRTRRMEGMSS